VTEQWEEAWKLANRYASCTCEVGGYFDKPDPFGDWAMEWEFWNSTDSGHGIMASLALDGAPCEALP